MKHDALPVCSIIAQKVGDATSTCTHAVFVLSRANCHVVSCKTQTRANIANDNNGRPSILLFPTSMEHCKLTCDIIPCSEFKLLR